MVESNSAPISGTRQVVKKTPANRTNFPKFGQTFSTPRRVALLLDEGKSPLLSHGEREEEISITGSVSFVFPKSQLVA